MEIAAVTDGETIPSELSRVKKARSKSKNEQNKKSEVPVVFKESSRIVTEEFAQLANEGEASVVLLSASRELECLRHFKVDKAKPGFTAWPSSELKKHLPAGLVIAPF